MRPNKSEIVRKQCLSAIKGAVIFLLIPMFVATLLILPVLGPTLLKATPDELSVYLGVAPSTADQGETVTFSWWVEGVYSEHLVEVEFYILDPDGSKVKYEMYGRDGVGSKSSPIVKTWDVPSDASPGTYQCTVEAHSGMSKPFPFHGTSTISFSVRDAIPPTIELTYSPESPTTEDKVTFTATASDPGGIDRIEIWVNARLVKTCTSSPCTYIGGPYPEGKVTYGANAYDKAGNRAWTGYKSFTVVEVELPDLVITEIKCDWENHRIGYKIRNIGKVVAPACHDALLEVEFEEGRWERMCRDHVDVDLERETSYEGWFECYTLPACKTMAVKVGADAYNSIDESNEDNNWLEGECICEEELPDLEITDVWNTDSQICYRIRNIGEATADTPVNALYIDDEWVAEDCLPEPLEPGEQVEKRCFDYHWQLTDAYDLVEVCADWQGDIYEGDEDNNCLSLVIAPPFPDLVVSIVGPETAMAGEDIDIEATVRNIGSVLAPGRINEDGTLNPDGYLVDVILSSDGNIPIQYRGEATGLEEFAEDMLLNTLSQTVSILPGEKATYTLSTHIPGNTPGGTCCLGAVVDPGRVVDEHNEANNTYCHQVELCPKVEFDFSEGGRQVETSIPIFGEPDTDEDGVNDCWENAAMEALEPLLELDEEEGWLEHQNEHNVRIFARVWPYTNDAGVTYIIFYYMVTWSKDYGRFGFSEHNGDTEPIVTAWRILNDNTIRMEWVYTSAHGGHCDAHAGVWSPWEETCNVGSVCGAEESVTRTEEFCAELEFSEPTEFQPPRLLIQVSEDKHAMYPTCEVCEEVSLLDAVDYARPYVNGIPVFGAALYGALQGIGLGWYYAAPILGFLWDVVTDIGGAISSAFSTAWDRMTGWDDDPLGKEVVMLTYDHMREGVDPWLNFRDGDYHYVLSWHIENHHFPSVRVIIDDLFCVDETDPERVWAFGWRNWVHDEPYLIITGFSTYPSIEVWPVGEPYFTGVDDNVRREIDLVVFDGEVTTKSLIGFNVVLFEDDGSDTDSGDRREIGEGMCDELRNGFLGVAEVVECEESNTFLLTLSGGEDCSGGEYWLFPVYNVGEPGELEEDQRLEDLTPEELDKLLKKIWIRDLTPYGFSGEHIAGIYYNEKKRFCGGLGCNDESPGSIYDSIKEMPSQLKKKLD